MAFPRPEAERLACQCAGAANAYHYSRVIRGLESMQREKGLIVQKALRSGLLSLKTSCHAAEPIGLKGASFFRLLKPTGKRTECLSHRAIVVQPMLCQSLSENSAPPAAYQA